MSRHLPPRSATASPRSRSKVEAITYGSIRKGTAPMLKRAAFGFIGLLIAGLIELSFRRPDYVGEYCMIALAAAIPLLAWNYGPGRGAPVLPALVVQQLIVFLMPLYVENASVGSYSSHVLDTSASSVMWFLLLLPVGWYLGLQAVRSHPSKWNIDLSGQHGASRTMTLALTLMGAALAFEIGTKADWLKSLPPIILPVLKAVLTAASTLGAFLGGYSFKSGGRKAAGIVLYWCILAGLFLFKTSAFLLSPVTGLVLAAGVGIALGTRKIPWLFAATAGFALAFLNMGKFPMREKYWGPNGPGSALSLSNMPALYREWAEASLEKLAVRRESPQVEDKKGQSLLERMDNLQNLAFVVEAQTIRDVRTLGGETYSLIPPLLVPRFLWHDKPRTHEGQILLNLHFGRQQSIEQTETTYVAWGLLPEAVGNFGPLGGALFLGPIFGFFLGIVEQWSTRKRLFSVEGLAIAAFLLQLLVSFEMVASVFITATFQMLVAVAIGGTALRYFLGSSPEETARPARRKALDPGPSGPAPMGPVE